MKCCETDLWMCNSFTALKCCESAVAAAGTAMLLCSETSCRSALRLRTGGQVPECRLLIMQPPCRLSKLAKRTAWEHGDIMAHFTHAPYIFGQIAMYKRSRNSNGTLPRCVCFDDSGEFIQAFPSKYRCAIALLWSAKPYGFPCLHHCRLFVCTHDYAVKRLMCRRCLCSTVGMSLHHSWPGTHATEFSVAHVNARTQRNNLSCLTDCTMFLELLFLTFLFSLIQFSTT